MSEILMVFIRTKEELCEEADRRGGINGFNPEKGFYSSGDVWLDKNNPNKNRELVNIIFGKLMENNE